METGREVRSPRVLARWALARVQQRESLRVLRVPGSGHVVFAREGTSDAAAFEEVFSGAYDVEPATPPRTVVDLGANVGYASVLFALRWPGARVLAVEPDAANARLLRRNVAGLPVDVVRAAVWSRAGSLALEDPGKGRWGFRVQEAEPGAGGVPAVTIHQLLARLDAPFVDVLKVDVEGSETELLAGDVAWLRRVGVLAIELHDRYRPGCRAALDDALARAGSPFRESRLGATVVLTRTDLDGPSAPSA